MLTSSVRSAIEAGHLAHLTTLNDDGSPQTTIVWVGVEGEQLVMASMDDRAKLRNIRRDGRVSVSLETGGTTGGLANYLVVEGSAEVVEGGAPELLRALAVVYLGPDVPFLAEERRPGFRILITPTHIRGNGPWTE